MTAPWLQTGSGRAFDLLDPQPGSVDFAIDIAEALARIPRFTGHVRAGAYSVAQHCALGADLLFAETSRPDLAAAFLLHDAHEAYLGDIATPIATALSRVAFDAFLSYKEEGVMLAIRKLKANVDNAIHSAAGIKWPLSVDVAKAVKVCDMRMLRTERDHLLGKSPRPHIWDEVEPIQMRGAIKVWPWPTAADEYRVRLRRWCPAALDSRP